MATATSTSHTVHLPATAEQVYRWHTRLGAFERLVPPWERVQVLQREGHFERQRVKLGVRLGPLRLSWVSRHHEVTSGHTFVDTQESGPFAAWRHERRFIPVSAASSCLEERIDYRLPGGAVAELLVGRTIRDKISQMMQYRHRVLRSDLAVHHGSQRRDSKMKVAVVGASGLVGSALVPFLTSGDHTVRRVGRTKTAGSTNDFAWDYRKGHLESGAFDGVDAVVHLAGENIGSRWTAAKKAAIRSSRVEATRFLCQQIAALERPPATLVCASAIGYYGDRGADELTERSARGAGMLAELCEEWESAAEVARARGIRVVHVRFGIILSPRGGPLARMLPPFRLGLGGKLGNGQQYTSWIAIDDAVGVLYRALTDDSLQGPVNAVAPQSLTNAAFTQTLGRVLGRPTIVPAPAFALRAVFGEMTDDVLLASTRVVPEKLEQIGYAFQQPNLDGALRHLLGRSPTS